MKELKTLLERVTPELKEKIKVYEEQYPNSGAYLKALLAEHRFVSDLPYGVIIDIEALYKEPRINVFEKFEHI